MSTSSGIGLALAAAGAIASIPASAAPVTFTQTVSLGAVLDGTATTLNFDVGSFLAGSGYSAGDVVGGDISVFGFSDASYGAAQASPYSGYQQTGSPAHTAYYSYYVGGGSSCSWWSCYYYPGYYVSGAYTIYDVEETRYRDINHIDAVADELRISAGAASATGQVSNTTSSVGGYGGAWYDGNYCRYVDGNGNCSWDYRYSRERDVYQAIAGNLQSSLSFDAVALGDIAADGLLAIGMEASRGHVTLNSLTVNLQVERSAAAAVTVPEPAGLALTGVALAAALVAGRRRRTRHADDDKT